MPSTYKIKMCVFFLRICTCKKLRATLKKSVTLHKDPYSADFYCMCVCVCVCVFFAYLQEIMKYPQRVSRLTQGPTLSWLADLSEWVSINTQFFLVAIQWLVGGI